MSKPRTRHSQRPSTPSSAPSDRPPHSPRPGSPSRKRRRKRTRASQPPRTEPSSVRPHARLGRLGVLVLGVLAALAFVLAGLWVWALLPGAAASPVVLVVPPGLSTARVLELVAEQGVLARPRLFRVYLALLRPGFEAIPGSHVLGPNASARELAQRLERSANRPSQRVTVPEGFQLLQIGQRLERAQICSATAFRAAVTDPSLLHELDVAGASAEGYLFPASYGLLVDSDAKEVVRVFVTEAKKRLALSFEHHPGRLAQLEREFGFGEREVLTLASMVEKEARAEDERPLIASVFFNRLRDANFRPARMLQSDPTASYGCLMDAAHIPSCAGFHGSVTPALLRDPLNPYNTYRHPGLPPGPIANPGSAAIDAVLAPTVSDFLYFVAKGAGRHSFSRTFAEHREALETPH